MTGMFWFVLVFVLIYKPQQYWIMAKVLILQNEISAYNVSTYNCISELHELTVAYYSKDKSSIPCSFQKHKLNYIKIKSIILVSDLKSLCKQFDVVIFVPDFHVPAYCLLPFGNRRYKVISWSIGFRVSYVHPYITYRKHNLLIVFSRKCYQHVMLISSI